MRRFAEAFEVVPRTLAENAGMQATEVIASLYASFLSSYPVIFLCWIELA